MKTKKSRPARAIGSHACKSNQSGFRWLIQKQTKPLEDYGIKKGAIAQLPLPTIPVDAYYPDLSLRVTYHVFDGKSISIFFKAF